MNKKILIGSIGAVFLLFFMSFTSVVNAQTTTSNNKIIKENLKLLPPGWWYPGAFIDLIFMLVIDFILWLSVTHPSS